MRRADWLRSAHLWPESIRCSIVVLKAPLVGHRQQAPSLPTGVRQGLEKVHQTSLMRTVRVSFSCAVRVHAPGQKAGSPLPATA